MKKEKQKAPGLSARQLSENMVNNFKRMSENEELEKFLLRLEELRRGGFSLSHNVLGTPVHPGGDYTLRLVFSGPLSGPKEIIFDYSGSFWLIGKMLKELNSEESVFSPQKSMIFIADPLKRFEGSGETELDSGSVIRFELNGSNYEITATEEGLRVLKTSHSENLLSVIAESSNYLILK